MGTVKLFVDANVFLDFFREDMRTFHTLVESLAKMSGSLLVTERVANEVRRNKVSVACEALLALKKQIKFPALRLPDHLDEPGNGSVAELNRRLAEALQITRQLEVDVVARIGHLVEQIALSRDPTSVALETLFEKALVASPDQLGRARARREVGDPPGKTDGPLGDQLSWEQILDACGTGAELCVATRDQDFFDTIGDKVFLNPVLARELSRRNVTGRPFRRLVDAIEYVEKRVATAPAVPRPDADEIRREEDASNTAHTHTIVFVPSGMPPVFFDDSGQTSIDPVRRAQADQLRRRGFAVLLDSQQAPFEPFLPPPEALRSVPGGTIEAYDPRRRPK